MGLAYKVFYSLKIVSIYMKGSENFHLLVHPQLLEMTRTGAAAINKLSN